MYKNPWQITTQGRPWLCVGCKKSSGAKPPTNCPEIRHKTNYEKALMKHRQWFKTYYPKNKDYYLKKSGVYYKKWFSKIFIEVFNHYGNKCACCGFNETDVKVRGRSIFEIDHIDGGGTKDRKIKGGGWRLYLWLKKNNYPSGYRLLDTACNNAMVPGESICELHKWELKRYSACN